MSMLFQFGPSRFSRRVDDAVDVPPTDPPRRKMVGWYDPGQLLATGMEVFVSSLLGQRSDYRTMEDVGLPQQALDYTRHGTVQDLWFDYMADTGDGWESTYAMACLVAQPWIELGDGRLPGGAFLLLGGDAVYPSASKRAYRERLVAPLAAALPAGGVPRRDILAIPGNHDWYDGLVSFSRLFTQGRTLGGWQTRQRRSYFALQLPRRWWLWAVDVQLESDIDVGQLNYFRSVGDALRTGDGIILASAEPDWLYRDIKNPMAESNLAPGSSRAPLGGGGWASLPPTRAVAGRLLPADHQRWGRRLSLGHPHADRRRGGDEPEAHRARRR
jgi:hypothetical protein